MTDPTESLQLMLAEVRSEVPLADQKASMVLAGIGIGAGALLGGLLAGDWSPDRLNQGGEAVWWIGASLLLAAVISAGSAVWPRVAKRAAGEGIFYWAHVADFASQEVFASAFAALPPDADRRATNQLWHLSRLVRAKYLSVKIALSLAGAAVGAFLLSVLVG